MSEKQINWCTCDGHDHEDWRVRSELYTRRFVPTAWVFEHSTITCHEEGRVLYITGKCDRCGGFMRSGTSVPINVKGDELLAYVYRGMKHFRPYDGHDQEKGIYCGCISQRCRWYQQQDDLTLEARNEQFLRLFRAEDQAAVKDWLTRNHNAEPHTKPRRDRKSTLLQRILEAARADGAIAEAILDYILPNDREPECPDRDSYLTDYRFDLIPSLNFGSCEGIYLSLYLEGSFDGSDKKKAAIGTFKTLRTDLEACRLMGALGGALMYYGSKYVNEEIHRYTPKAELEREVGRNGGRPQVQDAAELHHRL